ncbi:hypothetical protein [Bradyrhizobium macuxiense]|uniref:hypothetical protein n=1 Tax=Bradyrhizobium macuxiense TaxID=1755647 RepID=UPI0010A961D0|nr:hypothetical protein [Bradyrhizobium macuxiense]
MFWAQILVGSLSLMMIHRLTSGGWGEIIAPVTEPSAAAIPLLLLLAVPIFVAIPALYPWAQRPLTVKPDVLSLYLNRPAFVVRSLVALAGWSALAFFLPRAAGGRGQLLAALGLAFHAVIISSVSIDWYLSIEAPFTSSSFGASVAITSLVAALAWATMWMPAPDDEPAIGDVGALLLATILGITYIDFMAVLVIWYGDLPREEAWFVARSHLPWTALAGAAFALGSLIPTLVLLQSRVRNQRRPLRVVGIITLVGIAANDAYLIAPARGVAALPSALLAVIGMGLIIISVTSFLARSGAPRLFAWGPSDVR